MMFPNLFKNIRLIRIARLITGRLFPALLISAITLLSGCKEEIELHTRLSESDANEVIAALVENRISASKQNTKDGVTVFIDQADIAGAVRILQARGLPRKNKTSMGEVFQKEGIISSPLEERARYIYALSQELEYTFSQIAGVVVARVHVVLPEKVAPGEPIQPSSAAVFIKHQDSLDPDVALPKIKRMVASSIPGLADAGNEAIAVVFMPTKVSHQPLKSDLMLKMENEMGARFFDKQIGSDNPSLNQQSQGGYYTLNIAIGLLIMALLIAATTLRKSIFGKRAANTVSKRFSSNESNNFSQNVNKNAGNPLSQANNIDTNNNNHME